MLSKKNRSKLRKKFLFKKYKYVSPLIATILLIVVSVILITVVLTWSSNFAKDNLSTAQTSKINNKDFIGLITNSSLSAQNILISNNHSSKDLNVVGYKIISSLDHYLYDYFENKLYYLEEPLIIGSKQAEVLQIDCYPEESFFIDLLTDQNTYVRTQVLARSINDVDPLRCRLLFDYDVTSGTQIERTGKILTLLGVESTNIVENRKNYAQVTNGGYKLKASSNFIGTGSITIVFWANYNDISLGTYLLDNGAFFIDGSTTNRMRIRSDGLTTALSNSNYVNPTTTQFFAITRDVDGYVNFYSGDSTNTPTCTHTDQSSGIPIDTETETTIFGLSSSNTSGFRGKMMMLKVYDNKLTIDEITTLWNNTKSLIE